MIDIERPAIGRAGFHDFGQDSRVHTQGFSQVQCLAYSDHLRSQRQIVGQFTGCPSSHMGPTFQDARSHLLQERCYIIVSDRVVLKLLMEHGTATEHEGKSAIDRSLDTPGNRGIKECRCPRFLKDFGPLLRGHGTNCRTVNDNASIG